MVLLDELSMEFHCDLQLWDASRNVNSIASGAGGGVADRVLEEVSHETVSCVVGYVRIMLGSFSDHVRIGSAL